VAGEHKLSTSIAYLIRGHKYNRMNERKVRLENFARCKRFGNSLKALTYFLFHCTIKNKKARVKVYRAQDGSFVSTAYFSLNIFLLLVNMILLRNFKQTGILWEIHVKLPNTKYNENPSTGSQSLVTNRRTDIQGEPDRNTVTAVICKEPNEIHCLKAVAV